MTPRHPFAAAVVEIVATAYGIDPELIWGGARMGATITEARWLSWGQAKKMCGWSSVETGRAFGIDGSTVLYALRKLEGRVRDGTHTDWYTSAAQALDKLSVGAWQAVKCPVFATITSTYPPRAPSPSGISDSGSEGSLFSSDLKEPISKPARATPKSAKWRFVPDDWQPSDAHRELAVKLRLDLEQQVELFRNHEFAKPKSNADKTFNRWLLQANGFGNGKPPGLQQHEHRRPYHAPFKPEPPTRPEDRPTDEQVAGTMAMFKPASVPAVAPARRMTAAELDRAVDEMAARRKT